MLPQASVHFATNPAPHVLSMGFAALTVTLDTKSYNTSHHMQSACPAPVCDGIRWERALQASCRLLSSAGMAPIICIRGISSTCVNGVRWELASELLSHTAPMPLAGQAVLAGGEAPHDKLKQP